MAFGGLHVLALVLELLKAARLLFFAAHPQTGAPYAFIELRRVCIAHMDEGATCSA